MTNEEAAQYYSENPLDIAIIGGGPAGLSAAINGRVRGRSTAIISVAYENSPLFKAQVVDNMPGHPAISGANLLELYTAHALTLGAYIFKGTALLINATTDSEGRPLFQIAYDTNFLQAKTLILATGVAVGKPYQGEDLFLGRGVSYCATCDGMLYRGKTVAVIAKSKEAVEEAIHLQKIGCKVILFVNPNDLLRWDITLPENFFEAVRKEQRFQIEGQDTVEFLLADGDRIPLSGVFILRPTIAPSTLLNGLALEGPFIQTDRSQSTNIPGVFAAGDCTGKPLQIAKAVGEGLIAALSSDAFISAQEKI